MFQLGVLDSVLVACPERLHGKPVHKSGLENVDVLRELLGPHALSRKQW